MGVRYIGSKLRIADAIIELAGPADSGRFVDAFSGTGSVASAAADNGWAVTVNDALPSAVAMSVASVAGRQNVSFESLGGYASAISALNAVVGARGFLYSEYSPASLEVSGIERRYFTKKNAARLDAMRTAIGEWSDAGLLTWLEEQILLADLMMAANRVANISGTYGCFLRQWSGSALRDVELRERELPDRYSNLVAGVGDVFDLHHESSDVVYYDPPYTKRQYSAYYHVLETIHAGDSPKVSGVTGLRPWQEKASVFCYKTKALDALTELVANTKAKKVLLSYSSEGHVPMAELTENLSVLGKATLHSIKEIGRYRPNSVASAAGDSVHEFLIEVEPFLVQGMDTEISKELAVVR